MKTKIPPYIRAMVLTVAMLAPVMLTAMVVVENRGAWPAAWPKELEPFRSQAQTVEFAAGNQENVYEITFTNRADFERVWPVILQLKTPGAPLALYSTNNPSTTFFPNDHAAVRIWAPPGNGPIYPAALAVSDSSATNNDRIARLLEEGKLHELRAEPPWPGDIVSTNGGLPEYVVGKEENGTMRWVPANLEADRKENRFVGFYYRARVDLDLVVDGQIIDLNAIRLPANSPVHDHRFEK